MKKLYTILCLSALLSTTGLHAESVLEVSDASLETSLIMPSSFETDVKKMQENWYLQNYAILDYEADEKNGDKLNDEIILDRLSRMPTIIEMPLNTPVRNAIEFYAKRRKQLVENMLGMSLYYMPIFEEALERHGLPTELRYLPVIESALVPDAVSRAGAAGLWQFMPPTAKDLGLEINSLIDQRRDPYLSSEAAAKYLKQLFRTYNDWSLAIAAYNCGPGNVNKAIRRAGDGKHDFWDIYPFLPAETRNYVPAFIAANYIMTYYKEHNISPALARRPLIVDSIHVSRRVHFDQISQVLDIPIEELRALNPQFRTDLIPGNIRPYSLVLPSLQVYAYLANEDSIVNHNASNYARRGVVEPALGKVVGRDAKGEYYEVETIKYHTVKRGENLSKIAKRYGVTVSSIRKLNNIGKKVKTGKKLKIKTVERKYKPRTQTIADIEPATTPDSISPVPEQTAANVDTTLTRIELTDTVAVAKAAEKKPVVKEEPKKKKEPKKSQNITHRVRKGDNLGKIARRYGVTINAIKQANNLTSDRINIGQRLKIPQK